MRTVLSLVLLIMVVAAFLETPPGEHAYRMLTGAEKVLDRVGGLCQTLAAHLRSWANESRHHQGPVVVPSPMPSSDDVSFSDPLQQRFEVRSESEHNGRTLETPVTEVRPPTIEAWLHGTE